MQVFNAMFLLLDLSPFQRVTIYYTILYYTILYLCSVAVISSYISIVASFAQIHSE